MSVMLNAALQHFLPTAVADGHTYSIGADPVLPQVAQVLLKESSCTTPGSHDSSLVRRALGFTDLQVIPIDLDAYAHVLLVLELSGFTGPRTLYCNMQQLIKVY